MKDINDMSMKDFSNLLYYLKNKEEKDTGKWVPLKDSQKDMIKRAKEQDKHG